MLLIQLVARSSNCNRRLNWCFTRTVVYSELTKYPFAEGALFHLIAAPTIKSGPHKLGPVEPGGCETVKFSPLFETVFG